MYKSVCATTHVWESEGKLQELVVSFCHVGLRDETQVIGIGCRCLCPLSHLGDPIKVLFYTKFILDPDQRMQ